MQRRKVLGKGTVMGMRRIFNVMVTEIGYRTVTVRGQSFDDAINNAGDFEEHMEESDVEWCETQVTVDPYDVEEIKGVLDEWLYR